MQLRSSVSQNSAHRRLSTCSSWVQLETPQTPLLAEFPPNHIELSDMEKLGDSTSDSESFVAFETQPRKSLELVLFLQALLVCLAVAATAAPQFHGRYRPYDGRHIAILSQSQEGPIGARFRYQFQTENGINVEARGTPGVKGQSNIDGSFRWVRFGRICRHLTTMCLNVSAACKSKPSWEIFYISSTISSFPFPEGGTGHVTYVADENGYRPESPLIPTPHPLPAHAIEQIRFAESQRRRGWGSRPRPATAASWRTHAPTRLRWLPRHPSQMCKCSRASASISPD